LRRRLERDELAALELFTLYLGDRLGLYRALAEGGPATSSELAARTGTVERYCREWLEQQTVSGFLRVEDETAPPGSRRYYLPPEHVPVLVDEDDLDYAGFKGVDVVRQGRPLPDLVEAFRSGGAPPPLAWEPEGRADFNRARYLTLLGQVWLPSIADVHARLRADPPARVADIACGTGWSTIAMALAYPKARFDGFDLDERAIDAAGANAAARGVAGRIRFAADDAADPGLARGYDLATIFEALHDMSRPVAALAAARRLLSEGGSVIVADELVGDEFRAATTEREQASYGWSVVSCLPAAMGDPETAATGAVLRSGTLRRYAEEAGFRRVEILPIETEFWRFYRLWP
jgi:2-polyprenyl-3-methyl-5-hydroxy-6-metoxy-1,4-benzoquinol methylase